jgi:hypothetical protein
MSSTSSPVLERRHYATSDLPVLRVASGTADDRDTRLRLYTEVCATWRALVDTRFKLLALVPGATLLIVPSIVSGKGLGENLSPTARLLVCLFGLAVTLGLFVYDSRNSELHDDLVSRGRRIEHELGIHTGVFLGRRDPGPMYSHGRALGLIYGSSLAAWAVASLQEISMLVRTP